MWKKQAPKPWQTLLSSWLISYGFCQSKSDPSLYTLIHDGHMFAQVAYVDECLLIEKKCKFLKVFKHNFYLDLKFKISVQQLEY